MDSNCYSGIVVGAPWAEAGPARRRRQRKPVVAADTRLSLRHNQDYSLDILTQMAGISRTVWVILFVVAEILDSIAHMGEGEVPATSVQ